MKIYTYCLLSLFLLNACQKEKVPTQSSDNAIIALSFKYDFGREEFSNTYIDEANHRIVIHPQAYANTDYNHFQVNFRTSDKAEASPASGSLLDVSQPTTITVTAEDGTKANYTLVRSLAPISAEAYDKEGALARYLTLETVREAKVVGADLHFTLGKTGTVLTNGNPTVADKLIFTVKGAVENNQVKPGTYEGSTQCTAQLLWPYSNFFFGTIRTGNIVIDHYDPVLKVCSGRIERLTSVLRETNTVIERSLTVNGEFENIPIVP